MINRQLQSFSTLPADREPKPLDAATKSAAQFASCSKKIRDAVRQAYRLRTEALATEDGPNRALAFQRAADAFLAIVTDFPIPTTDEQERLRNVLREEVAFCYMFTKNAELRIRAEKIYRELLVAWPDRVSVMLRLGQLCRDAGEFAEARKLMESALALAEANPEEDADGQRQTNWVLRRDLAYIYWRLTDLDWSRDDALQLLRRAVEFSEAAIGYARGDNQLGNTRENLLYYLADIWKRFPSDRRKQDEMRGKELLTELRSKVDLEKSATEILDTLVRAEAAFGELQRSKAAAKVVNQRLREKIEIICRDKHCSHTVAFDSLSRDERDMYLNSQEVLAASGS